MQVISIHFKRCFRVFVFLVFAYSGYAQDPVPPATPTPPQPVYPVYGTRSSEDFFDKTRFGVHFDPSLSFMGSRDNQIENARSKIAIMTGINMEFYFAPRYSIITGFDLWFGQGGTLRYKHGGDVLKNSSLSDPIFHNLPANAEVRYSLNYFCLPVGLKLRSQSFGNKRFWVEFPLLTPSIRIRAKADIEAAGGLTTEDENVADDVPFFNMFFGGGAGAEFPLGTETDLIVGLKYQNSLFDVFKDDGIRPNGVYDSKDKVGILSLKVGVIF